MYRKTRLEPISHQFKRFGFIVVICAELTLPGCGDNSERPPERPVPTVTTEVPKRQDVTEYYHYTGTTEAVEDVEIRARVSGYLESVHFEPSTDVKEGDLLFRIESAPYKAAADAASAELSRAQATLGSAEAQYNHILKSFKNNAASELERIEAEAAYKEAQANVEVMKAKLATANIDLSYTEIRAPLDGRIGRKLISIGDLVGLGEPTLLTDIVQVDPIWVYVDVSERIVLEYIERGRDGRVSEHHDTVELSLANNADGVYPFVGVLDYVSNRVDEATGTIRVRGRFDNAQHKLFPGLFARVRVPFHQINDAVLVRQDALGSDLGGKYVLTVADDGTVSQKRVTLGPESGDLIVVRTGLKGDERYIVAGLQMARPGSKVKYETVPTASDTAAPADKEAASE